MTDLRYGADCEWVRSDKHNGASAQQANETTGTAISISLLMCAVVCGGAFLIHRKKLNEQRTKSQEARLTSINPLSGEADLNMHAVEMTNRVGSVEIELDLDFLNNPVSK